jgi:hypothetical protein
MKQTQTKTPSFLTPPSTISLSVFAMTVSILVGLATLLGTPKCSDVQTKAEAAQQKQTLEQRIDKLDAKVDKVIDLLLKGR